VPVTRLARAQNSRRKILHDDVGMPLVRSCSNTLARRRGHDCALLVRARGNALFFALAAARAIFMAGAGAALASSAEMSHSTPAAGLVLAAASLWFLAWNWPPAKIFMGDVGSGYLGFALGDSLSVVGLAIPGKCWLVSVGSLDADSRPGGVGGFWPEGDIRGQGSAKRRTFRLVGLALTNGWSSGRQTATSGTQEIP